MARYSHGNLARPHAPDPTILGNAAHRASPRLVQGVNMALLDALALVRALDHVPGPEALPEALRIYGAARRWHVRNYPALNAAFTPQRQGDSRWLPVLRDRIPYPLSYLPPLPGMLSALVAGRLLPPLGSLGVSRPRPEPRLAALPKDQAV